MGFICRYFRSSLQIKLPSPSRHWQGWAVHNWCLSPSRAENHSEITLVGVPQVYPSQWVFVFLLCWESFSWTFRVLTGGPQQSPEFPPKELSAIDCPFQWPLKRQQQPHPETSYVGPPQRPNTGDQIEQHWKFHSGKFLKISRELLDFRLNSSCYPAVVGRDATIARICLCLRK